MDMTAHIPAFILASWVPLIYMWSAAGHSYVSHLFEAMPVGWIPIHVLTALMIA